MKSDEGREIFLALVKKADVIIENFTPGVMKRLGLGYEDVLKEVNPRLIYASATGYGLEGPYSDFPGMDLTIQAMSGVMATTGFEGQPPVKAGPAVCDILGGIHLFGGIATALFHRERTGVGQFVEVAMHDAVYPTLASPLGSYYQGSKNIPERTGNRHSGLRTAPYNVYPTEDGYAAIICIAERHWRNLAKAMNREDLIDSPEFKTTIERAANMDKLDKIISEWTKTQKKWDLAKRLKNIHVPSAPVLSVDEVATDQHLKFRGMIRDVDHPISGKVQVPGSPIRLSNSPTADTTPAPLIGQHTEDILQNFLEMSAEQLENYKNKKIISK